MTPDRVWLEPAQEITLEGQLIRLEPLGVHHQNDLSKVSGEEEIWRYMPTPWATSAQLSAGIEQSLKLHKEGLAYTFAIIAKETGCAIGTTRYLSIEEKDRSLEIGFTWLGKPARRTGINTEAKFLLLQYAFESLGCIRVQLKADRRNERSRAAIERIGAKFEGILRQHRILRDGTYRDSAFYSIIDQEWPEVKQNLLAKLQRTTR